MPVALSRSGGTATVTITVNVADIVAAVGISAAEKKAQAIQRAAAELSSAIVASGQTDAEIDAQVAALKAQADTEAAARKVARPTGTL